MTQRPTVSVIINTDGRAASLAQCLESLQYLRYPNFEVIVVAGPTRDGTHELCEAWGSRIRYGTCDVRNLSRSRNISIQMSSGEIVAFLDDDSVPEPEWLDDVIPAFEDPEVAVAGGFLHDHTGKTYQWRYGVMDRFGAANTSFHGPSPALNFPYTANFPHVMANSAFRRSAIVEVGGFDEEYEYFLDESDIICRFVDNGWKVAQMDNGFIHHKFMPSHIRNESKVLTSWYSLVKNKTYFSLTNGRLHSTLDQVKDVITALVEEFRTHVRWAVNEGILGAEYLERYEDEVDRAFREGWSRGVSQERRLVPADSLKGVDGFKRFPTILPAAEQRCFVFLSKTYPPASIGGIGRYIHHLARAIGSQGHQVHVLTTGEGHDRVDFEEGVWVHRIVAKDHPVPATLQVPGHIWNHSRTMFMEAVEIASRRAIDAVYAPIWDVEGIAFLEDHRFPIVHSLQTTLEFYLDANPDKRADADFMESFAKPMLALERRVLAESDRIHAISVAIAEEIERRYQMKFDARRLDVVHLGLEDMVASGAIVPSPIAADAVRLTFIGRLESRKGIDVFLDIAADLLARHPNLHVDVVGNDKIPAEGGSTYRLEFEKRAKGKYDRSRLVFHGEVDEQALCGFYACSDIIVAPSRFESFGLVHLEAMMFGKPIVGCSIGGMAEIIEDEATGLLVAPGDSSALLNALDRLVTDDGLRQRLGAAGRKAYEQRFSAASMSEGVVGILGRTSAEASI